MADTATKLPVKSEPRSPAPSRGISAFENLRSEFERLFDEFTPSFWHRPAARLAFDKAISSIASPAVDVFEKGDSYQIAVELPGIDPKQIDLRVAEGVLTIKGEKQETTEERDKEYYLSERRYGSFQRMFRLPQGVDSSKIEASCSNGVLSVRLPKTAEAQKSERKIAIKSN